MASPTTPMSEQQGSDPGETFEKELLVMLQGSAQLAGLAVAIANPDKNQHKALEKINQTQRLQWGDIEGMRNTRDAAKEGEKQQLSDELAQQLFVREIAILFPDYLEHKLEYDHRLAQLNDFAEGQLTSKDKNFLHNIPDAIKLRRCPTHAENFSNIGTEQHSQAEMNQNYVEAVNQWLKQIDQEETTAYAANKDQHGTIIYLNEPQEIINHEGSIETISWVELNQETTESDPSLPSNSAMPLAEGGTNLNVADLQKQAIEQIRLYSHPNEGLTNDKRVVIYSDNFSFYPEGAKTEYTPEHLKTAAEITPPPEPSAPPEPSPESEEPPTSESPPDEEVGEADPPAQEFYPRYETLPESPPISLEEAEVQYPQIHEWAKRTKHLIDELQHSHPDTPRSQLAQELMERIQNLEKYAQTDKKDKFYRAYLEDVTSNEGLGGPEEYLLGLQVTKHYAEKDEALLAVASSYQAPNRRQIPKYANRDPSKSITSSPGKEDDYMAALLTKEEKQERQTSPNETNKEGLRNEALLDLQCLQLIKDQAMTPQQETELEQLLQDGKHQEYLAAHYEIDDALIRVLEADANPSTFDEGTPEHQMAQRLQGIEQKTIDEIIKGSQDPEDYGSEAAFKLAANVQGKKLQAIKRRLQRLNYDEIDLLGKGVKTHALKALKLTQLRRSPKDLKELEIYSYRLVQAPPSGATTPTPAPVSPPIEADPTPTPAKAPPSSAEPPASEPEREPPPPTTPTPPEEKPPITAPEPEVVETPEELAADLEPTQAEVEKVEEVEEEDKPSEEPPPPTTPAPTTEDRPEPTGSDDEPRPTTEGLTFKAAIAGVKGEIGGREVTRTGLFGRERQKTTYTRELAEVKAAEFARLMATEVRRKWEAPFFSKEGLKTAAERVWKGFLLEKGHYIKEKRHALDLMAATGLETDFPYELYERLDQQARTELQAQRSQMGRFKRLLHGAKDFAQEVAAKERDLHKTRVKIAQRWREQYEADPLNVDNPLHPYALADIKAMDAVAARLGETQFDTTLHSALGETRTTEAILLSSTQEGEQVRNFLKNKVLVPLLASAIKSPDGRVDQQVELQARRDLNNFFVSDKFQNFLAQNDKIDFSLSYANNIVDQVTSEEYLTLVNQALEHGKKLEELDFDVELTLGTARFGPTGEIPSRVWGEKRTAQNQRLREKLNKALASKPENERYGIAPTTIRNAEKRATWFAYADDVLGLTGYALLPEIGFRLGAAALKLTPLAAAAPLASSLGLGVRAGIKQHKLLNSTRAQFNLERALGYTRPEDARRAAQMARFDYHRVPIDARVQQLTTHAAPELDQDNIHALLGFVVDTRARRNLSAKYNIELWNINRGAVPETGSPQAAFQTLNKDLDVALAQAELRLKQYLQEDNHQVAVAAVLGLDPDQDILKQLTSLQQSRLESGVNLDESTKLALDCVDDVQAEQTIIARNKAFNRWRTGQTVKAGAIATGTSIVAREVLELGRNITQHGLDTQDWNLKGPLSGLGKALHNQGTTITEQTHPLMGLDKTHEVAIGVDEHLDLPEAVTWQDNGDGTQDLILTLTDDQGTQYGQPIVVADNIRFNGGVPQDSQDVINALKQHDDLFKIARTAPTTHTRLVPNPEALGASAPTTPATGTPEITLDIKHITGAQMAQNGGSLHGYIQDQAQETLSDSHNSNATMNTLKAYARAYADHHADESRGLGRLVAADNDHLTVPNYNLVPPTDETSIPIPEALLDPQTTRRIDQVVAEAIQMKSSGEELDRLHELALVGYTGLRPGDTTGLNTIPTEDQLYEFLDLLGVEPTAPAVTPAAAEVIPEFIQEAYTTPGETVVRYIGGDAVRTTVEEKFYASATDPWGMLVQNAVGTAGAAAVSGFRPLEAPEPPTDASGGGDDEPSPTPAPPPPPPPPPPPSDIDEEKDKDIEKEKELEIEDEDEDEEKDKDIEKEKELEIEDEDEEKDKDIEKEKELEIEDEDEEKDKDIEKEKELEIEKEKNIDKEKEVYLEENAPDNIDEGTDSNLSSIFENL